MLCSRRESETAACTPLDPQRFIGDGGLSQGEKRNSVTNDADTCAEAATNDWAGSLIKL